MMTQTKKPFKAIIDNAGNPKGDIYSEVDVGPIDRDRGPPSGAEKVKKKRYDDK